MVTYLRQLNGPRLVLWCYLIWYLSVASRYFDPSPSLWLNSLGISVIIGTGLYLSTSRASSTPVRLGAWQVLRLYLMPFCVSSFAALIKGRGFWLVLHPNLDDNLNASACCALFLFAVYLVKSTSAGTTSTSFTTGSN